MKSYVIQGIFFVVLMFVPIYVGLKYISFICSEEAEKDLCKKLFCYKYKKDIICNDENKKRKKSLLTELWNSNPEKWIGIISKRRETGNNRPNDLPVCTVNKNRPNVHVGNSLTSKVEEYVDIMGIMNLLGLDNAKTVSRMKNDAKRLETEIQYDYYIQRRVLAEEKWFGYLYNVILSDGFEDVICHHMIISQEDIYVYTDDLKKSDLIIKLLSKISKKEEKLIRVYRYNPYSRKYSIDYVVGKKVKCSDITKDVVKEYTDLTYIVEHSYSKQEDDVMKKYELRYEDLKI